MTFTQDEKEYLQGLLKREIERFEKEGDSILTDLPAPFVAAEQRYDDFLKALLKKLE